MGYQSTVQVIQRGGKNRQVVSDLSGALGAGPGNREGRSDRVGSGGQAHDRLEAHSPADRGIFEGGGERMSEGREGQQKTIWAESEGPAEPPAAEAEPGEPRAGRVSRRSIASRWCCARWTWSSCWSPTTWRGRFGR